MAKYTSKTALQLTGSDIRTMTRGELARMVSTIASAANKRIDRLEAVGQPVSDTWGRFSVAGKNRAELMREFSQLKQFMNSPQNSLSGQAELRREVARRLAHASRSEEKTDKQVAKELKSFLNDKETYNKYWRAYEQLKELNPSVKEKTLKYKVLAEQKQLMQNNPRLTVTSVANIMNSRIRSVYGQLQEEKAAETPSDVFTIE